jgi:hypothetical protein
MREREFERKDNEEVGEKRIRRMERNEKMLISLLQ